MEYLFGGWQIDEVDKMDEMNASFQCISLAYVCVCGCMIVIPKYEKYLTQVMKFDKLQWKCKQPKYKVLQCE
jgi:hypothetical protein